MARFGHLVLNKGVWDGDSILKDQEFYEEMINSSQNLNPAYGLLWWLNGKDKFILPGTAISFSGSLVPNAPEDMFAAMGKDDQRIYIIPSMNMVIVRQGEASGISLFAKSTFDDELWSYLNQLKCTNSVDEIQSSQLKVYPIPSENLVHIELNGSQPIQTEVLNLSGTTVFRGNSKTLNLSGLENGIYFLRIKQGDRIFIRKISLLR